MNGRTRCRSAPATPRGSRFASSTGVNGEFNDWTYGETTIKPRAFTWTPEVGGPDDGFWPVPSRIVPIAVENLRHCYYVASIAGPYVRVERSNVIGGPLVAASSHWVTVRARTAA